MITMAETLDTQLSKMPSRYQELFRQVTATPEIQERVHEVTKLHLANLHALVDLEKRDICFQPESRAGYELRQLLELGLLELRPYSGSPESAHLWTDDRFYHPTPIGVQIHDELQAQGYDFAPPEGAWRGDFD
ncbi:hypothetical protein HYX07_04485 [Candidatus Woesearchaeota archaeon]|nr:hypothetical protein [Candidatus Woesearchaeota archaeon]